MASLIAKGLLTEVASPAPDGDAIGHAEWPADLGGLLLSEYDDMTSIITMDPIHDVDPQRGWPFDERT